MKFDTDISIIIPTLNEAEHIAKLLTHVHACAPKAEKIVVDGGSNDNTLDMVYELFPSVRIIHGERAQRAHQMNLGAKASTREVMYFLHADTSPPSNFPRHIHASIQRGNDAGYYPFKYDRDSAWLKINAWFTQLPYLWCRGGDQSLYLTRRCWRTCGPYPEVAIMEEYDLINRIKEAHFSIAAMPGWITVSSRKYDNNSYIRIMQANVIAFSQYKNGVSRDRIKSEYLMRLRTS